MKVYRIEDADYRIKKIYWYIRWIRSLMDQNKIGRNGYGGKKRLYKRKEHVFNENGLR